MNKTRRLLYVAALLAIITTWYFIKKYHTAAVRPPNEKVLHTAINAKIQSLEPTIAQDYYTCKELAKVYEGLLAYHYLKRPLELIPNLAAAMPTVSADQLAYTFTIRQGVKFHDNRCFPNGKGRELTAHDFVYALKRLADPKQQSLNFGLLEGKIKGLDEWRQKYTDAEQVDYAEEVEGLVALDDRTLRVTLTHPWPQFLYTLTTAACYVFPPEAVAFYKEEFGNNPVGTGPFLMKTFKPEHTTLTYYRNPHFRATYFPSEAAPAYQHMLAYAGKKIPFVEKIVTNILPEGQPRWLSFNKGHLDVIDISRDMIANTVIQHQELIPALKAHEVQLFQEPELGTGCIVFNHADPLFKNNLKLRQALSMAFDGQQYNQLFHNGSATLAQSILPPGIGGYQKDYVNPYRKYDLQKAKQYLAEAGYPGGKGLPEITLDVSATTDARQKGEFIQKCMEKLGIRIQVIPNSFPELVKKTNTGATMMHMITWSAAYPDAEIFLKLFYSKNPVGIGINYHHPTYDALYEQAVNMPDSPARTKLYEQLNQFVTEQVPVIYNMHLNKIVLCQGWIKNYLLSDCINGTEIYMDVDMAQKRKILDKLHQEGK